MCSKILTRKKIEISVQNEISRGSRVSNISSSVSIRVEESEIMNQLLHFIDRATLHRARLLSICLNLEQGTR